MDDDKKRTLDEQMRELQENFVQTLLDKVSGTEPCSAQDLSCIRQFLKDNGYQIDPVKDKDALDDLMGKLEKKPEFPAIPSSPLN